MELRHYAGQPVGTQHLRGFHTDTAGPTIDADLHRIQRRPVGAGIGQSLKPVRLVAKCLVDLFDAALVLGGHVE